jgi:hypothetical protein
MRLNFTRRFSFIFWWKTIYILLDFRFHFGSWQQHPFGSWFEDNWGWISMKSAFDYKMAPVCLHRSCWVIKIAKNQIALYLFVFKWTGLHCILIHEIYFLCTWHLVDCSHIVNLPQPGPSNCFNNEPSRLGQNRNKLLCWQSSAHSTWPPMPRFVFRQSSVTASRQHTLWIVNTEFKNLLWIYIDVPSSLDICGCFGVHTAESHLCIDSDVCFTPTWPRTRVYYIKPCPSLHRCFMQMITVKWTLVYSILFLLFIQSTLSQYPSIPASLGWNSIFSRFTCNLSQSLVHLVQ